jgi:hypothetical protein
MGRSKHNRVNRSRRKTEKRQIALNNLLKKKDPSEHQLHLIETLQQRLGAGGVY